ncbi:Alpha/Beta hydrolase protein [Schizophyllum fasciatum]
MFIQLNHPFVILLTISFSLLILKIPRATAGPTVELGYATYEGTFDDMSSITQFLGMRYAAPPTGDLRWRPPQAPQHVDGVQQATSQPPMCPQAGWWGHAKSRPSFMKGERTTEKASLLDVYTHGDFQAQSYDLKPVLVWIHGGGYASNSATGMLGTDVWDGKYPLTRAKGNLVIVVVQYRLGMYGFLAGKEVHAGGSANAGLQDQQFSLRWVQEHIHKFGGNPSDVTIWGVSAGAGSVYQHVMANDGKTTPALFNTAVTSSAFVPPHCDNLDCLRKVDTITLQRLNANMGVSTFSGTYTFTPVVDGTLIKQATASALAKGKVNGNHLLSVANANEGQLFVNVFSTEDSMIDVAFYLRNVWPRLQDDEIERALKLYADLTPIKKASAILAEVVVAEFAVDNALHGFDIGYYFPDLNQVFPKTYNNSVFDSAFASTFTDFALAKDPNVKVAEDVTPAWAPWSADAPFEMVFNKTEDGVPDVRAASTDKRLLERCDFWQSIAPSVGQ